MKKLLLGTVGLVALITVAPAIAADVAVPTYTKAPPAMMAAVYDWGGFYGGLNAGGASSRNCWNLTSFSTGGATVTVPSTLEGCHGATGAIAGGQVGYRIQNGSFVFGLEALGDWAGLTGANRSIAAATAGLTNQTRTNALGLFTAHAGFTMNNVLFYLNGGAAVTNNKFSGMATATGAALDQNTETRAGAAVGTGIEFGFAPNWSASVEYDHLFMGTNSNTLTAANPGVARNDSIRQDLDLVTARVNYRWGGPGISKY